MKSDFYSHLVILSDKPIPSAEKLSWVDHKISVTYSDVDALIHVANTIFRGVVEIRHDCDMLYCMNNNVSISVTGRIPHFDDTTQDSDTFRPIGCMFDSRPHQCK